MGRVDAVPAAAAVAAAVAPRLSVTVAYSPHAGAVDAISVSLPVGASVADAVQASGLLQRHPGLDLANAAVGVWGVLRGLHELLRDADRVEIYRPLVVDPKEARRRRQQIQRNALRQAR